MYITFGSKQKVISGDSHQTITTVRLTMVELGGNLALSGYRRLCSSLCSLNWLPSISLVVNTSDRHTNSLESD